MTPIEARAVLGVGPDEIQQAVRSRYRALCRRLHPDAAADGGDIDRLTAVREAWKVLRPLLNEEAPHLRKRDNPRAEQIERVTANFAASRLSEPSGSPTAAEPVAVSIPAQPRPSPSESIFGAPGAGGWPDEHLDGWPVDPVTESISDEPVPVSAEPGGPIRDDGLAVSSVNQRLTVVAMLAIAAAALGRVAMDNQNRVLLSVPPVLVGVVAVLAVVGVYRFAATSHQRTVLAVTASIGLIWAEVAAIAAPLLLAIFALAVTFWRQRTPEG